MNIQEIFSSVKAAKADNSEIRIFKFENAGIEFLKEKFLSCDGSHYFFDRKGCVYLADKNGISKQTDFKKKYTFSRLKKNMRKSIRLEKYSAYIRKKDKKQTKSLTSDAILRCGKAVWYPSFKRLKFYNRSDGKCHRFRLHIPKRNNKNALIIFLHGAGAPGYDNFQQIWEVKHPYKHLKKTKKDCFILAPQLGYTDCYNTDEHSEMLWNMINAVNEKYGRIDFSRIYILGVSYGVYGTIYECFRHPERYAATVPTVACIYLENDTQVSYYKFGEDKYHLPFDENGISEIAKTPMWLACSHIEAKYVETLHKRHSAVNADVRLTRNDKHGHGMSAGFFKNEPWEEWLSGKIKNGK